MGGERCLSRVFAEAVTRVLDSRVPVLATVAAKGGGFIAAVSGRPDVEVITICIDNRDQLVEELASWSRSRWASRVGALRFRTKFVFPVATRFLWWCHNISSLSIAAQPPLRTGRALLTHPAPNHHFSPTTDHRVRVIAIRSVSFRGEAKGKRSRYA